MKTVLTKFLVISSAGLLMLASCKKEGVKVMSNGGKPGDLTANTTTLPLNKAMVNDTTKVITFNFTKANFGFSAAVTNVLQIDAQGDNWANPTTFTLPSGTYSEGFSTFDFNNLVLKLNLAAGVASQVNVRIAHTLAANVPAVYSNTLSLSVTPFNLTSWVYVVGAFDGWPPLPAKGTDSLISVTGNGVYTGIINFPANSNEFLILPQSNNYNNKYASNQDPNAGPTSIVTQNASNNLSAPKAGGQYTVTFNSNTGTISFTPADYYSVIGDAAQGWGTDVDMKYINDGSSDWVVTTPLLVQAAPNDGWKVRKDHAWTISYGTTSPADGHSLTSASGVNIGNAVAGTYTITFWLNPADNSGVTAFYTAVKQ
ncbi:MAG TPA: SusE domain-containing protein [Mucilaginibacter sp.]|nr:SusE domain-containing protein [Mucilaginibacter sp.]